jgi:hypothetical protein
MWGKSIAVGLILIAIVGIATAIEPDTNIYLTPHPDHISFYNNSTYITCNYTIKETNNATIRFEQYNTTNNTFDLVTDFGEFGTNTSGSFNIANSNYTNTSWYRAAMYSYGTTTGAICSFGIAVRSNESGNFEQLHGSVRFDDADSVPSVSFVEDKAGRGLTWLTGSGSLSHSLELWEYEANWTPSGGGNYVVTDHVNTSGSETLWALTETYTVHRYYAMVIYSSDYECLDYQLVQAVVPESNVVEVIARDIETDEQIMTFTATMTDVTKTASDGKVYFANVTNGEHLITVTSTDYMTGTQSIYMANNYVNTTVYLQRYSPYVPPHYIRFTSSVILPTSLRITSGSIS